jgi:tight adherence protein B
MTEYLIIVALVAIAAIGVYTAFGQTLRAQMAVTAQSLTGRGAGEARSEARTTARAAAASLGSRLMLPLGLGVLPAFVLVGVVPLVVSVVSSTVVTW